jgi:hypothetical protein
MNLRKSRVPRGKAPAVKIEPPAHSLAELQSMIRDADLELEAKKNLLADNEKKLQSANYSLRLHFNYYHDSDNPQIIADKSMINNLESSRSILSSEYQDLSRQLKRLHGWRLQIQLAEDKRLAAAADPEIRLAARRMFEAVKAAREACQEYQTLRNSFRRPMPGWPHWLGILNENSTRFWLQRLDKFLNLSNKK